VATYLPPEDAEDVAQYLTRTDENGWTYKARKVCRTNSDGIQVAVVCVYDEDDVFLGLL
jgi:hypothetical protein